MAGTSRRSLIVVVLAILVTWLGDLQNYGIALIDSVPSGVPLPAIRQLAGSGQLIAPALGVALIAFVESISAARAFQRAEDRSISADRELGALGLANVVASLLRGMPAGGGMSQTAVNDGAGARSPMAAIGTAVTVILTLLFLVPVFSYPPEAALGALVFVAAVSLVDLSTLRRIFAVERRDAVLVIIAALGVISVPADMLLVRPRSEIFFANFQHFRRDVYAALAAKDPRPTVLLIDGSGLFIFEFAGHQALREMIADLRSAGLEIWAVLPPGSAEDAVMRFRRIFGPEDIGLFPSAADAVATHLDQLGGPTDSG